MILTGKVNSAFDFTRLRLMKSCFYDGMYILLIRFVAKWKSLIEELTYLYLSFKGKGGKLREIFMFGAYDKFLYDVLSFQNLQGIWRYYVH